MLVLYDRLGCFCCNKPSERAGHDPVDLVQCGVARGEGAAAGACDAASRGVCVRCGGLPWACLSAEVAHSSEIGDQARARRVPSENFLRVRT